MKRIRVFGKDTGEQVMEINHQYDLPAETIVSVAVLSENLANRNDPQDMNHVLLEFLEGKSDKILLSVKSQLEKNIRFEEDDIGSAIDSAVSASDLFRKEQ